MNKLIVRLSRDSRKLVATGALAFLGAVSSALAGSHTVTFETGDHGLFGGSEQTRVETVDDGLKVTAPDVTANDWWVFVGWADANYVTANDLEQSYSAARWWLHTGRHGHWQVPLDAVTSNITVRAVYRPVSPLFDKVHVGVSIDSTPMSSDWSSTSAPESVTLATSYNISVNGKEMTSLPPDSTWTLYRYALNIETRYPDNTTEGTWGMIASATPDSSPEGSSWDGGSWMMTEAGDGNVVFEDRNLSWPMAPMDMSDEIRVDYMIELDIPHFWSGDNQKSVTVSSVGDMMQLEAHVTQDTTMTPTYAEYQLNGDTGDMSGQIYIEGSTLIFRFDPTGTGLYPGMDPGMSMCTCNGMCGCDTCTCNYDPATCTCPCCQQGPIETERIHFTFSSNGAESTSEEDFSVTDSWYWSTTLTLGQFYATWTSSMGTYSGSFEGLVAQMPLIYNYNIYSVGGSYRVLFSPGEHSEFVCGTTNGYIAAGFHACAPIVKPADGYKFSRWDTSFDKVTDSLYVRALCYKVSAKSGDYAVNLALNGVEAADDSLTLTGEGWYTGAATPASLESLGELTWSVWGSDEDGSNAAQVGSGVVTVSTNGAFTLTCTPSVTKAKYWVQVTADGTTFASAPLLAPAVKVPVAVIDTITPAEPNDVVETILSGHGTNGTIVAYRWTARRLEAGVETGAETLLGDSQTVATTLTAGDWRIALVVTDEDGVASRSATRDITVASAQPKADLSVAAETLVVRDENALAVAAANVGTSARVAFQVVNAGEVESPSGAMAYLFDGDGLETTDELLALTASNRRVLAAVPLAPIAAGATNDVAFTWQVGQNAAGEELDYKDELRLLTVVIVPVASADERTLANNVVRKGFGIGGVKGIEFIDCDLDKLLSVTLVVPGSLYQGSPFTASGKAVYTLGSTKTAAAGLNVTLRLDGSVFATTVTDASGAYTFRFEDGLSTIGTHTLAVTLTDGNATATATATTVVKTPAEPTLPKCDVAVSDIVFIGDHVRKTSARNFASAPGEEVSVKVSLKNIASQAAGAFSVSVSAQHEETGENVAVSFFRVDGLAYGATHVETIDLPQADLLQKSGNWIISVTSDIRGELDESNAINNRMSSRLTLEIERPDLSLSTIRLTSSCVVGETLVARARVCNNGPGAVTNAFRLSVAKYGSSAELGHAVVNTVLASGASCTVELDIPTDRLSAGDHTLVFTVDSQNAITEANEQNNCAYRSVTIYPDAARLRANDARLSVRPKPAVGETSAVSLRVVNSGGRALDGGVVVFTIEGRDVRASVGSISAFGGANAAQVVWTPTLSGTSPIRAQFYDKQNNLLLDVSELFDVAEEHVPAPQLAVTSSRLTVSPAEINVNDTVTFSATIANRGDKATTTASAIFLITDANGVEREVAKKSNLSIAAGGTLTVSASYAHIAQGSYIAEVRVSDASEAYGGGTDNVATKSFSVGEPLAIFATNSVACVIGENYRLDARASCWSTAYDWTLVKKPEGSTASLPETTTTGLVDLKLDVKGEYLVSLRTRYGEDTSLPAEMRLTASLRRLTASGGSNGSVSPNGASTWEDGATARVVATPNDGYRFVGWKGDLEGATSEVTNGVATCSLPMTANRTISAQFEQSRFTITYLYLKETVNPNPSTYDIGQAFTFAPLPDTDEWAFAGWDIAGVTAETRGAITVKASWHYKGSVVMETGWYLNGSRIVYGRHSTFLHTNVTQTVANAAPVITNGTTRYVCIGYKAQFGETTYAGETASFDLVPTSDGSVTWLYETNHWFEATANTNGTISCSEKGWKVHGTTETIECTPAEHYHVSQVEGDDTEGCWIAGNVVYVPMTQGRHPTVCFAIDTYTVSFDPGAHGAFTTGQGTRAVRNQSVDWGGSATAPGLTPDAGWLFKGWDAEATSITNNLTLHALYEMIPLTITSPDPIGPNTWCAGDSVRASFVTPEIQEYTKRQFVSWRVTVGANDEVVAEGTGTNFAFTVATDGAYKITSVWNTSHWLEIVSPEANGTLTGAESGWVAEGTNITLVATPDEDYVVQEWTGEIADGTLSSNSTVLAIAVNRPLSIGVKFELTPYTITYNCPWDFRLINSNRVSFTKIDAFAFEPLADTKSRRFLRWEPAGIEAGTRSNVTTTAKWEYRYGAVTFGDNVTYTNRVVVDQYVNRDLSYDSTDYRTHYDCVAWTAWNGTNAVETGTNSWCSFKIEAEGDYHVTLDTVVTNYLLSVWSSQGGRVTGSTNDDWRVAGSRFALVAEPEMDYEFYGWQGDVKGTTITTNTITGKMDRPRNITATFKRPQLDIGEAVNATNIVWTSEGWRPWDAIWDATSPDGHHHAASGAVDAGETSALAARLDGKGTLTFKWRWTGTSVSNVVSLIVDGAEEQRLTTSNDWREATVELGFGQHEVRWVCSASDPDAANDGVASLDQVSWVSHGILPDDVTFAEALNFTNALEWTTGGAAEWKAYVAETAYEGGAAAYTGDLGANATGWLATKVEGPGRVSFAWQNAAPTESLLTLAVDGKTVLTNASGSAWTTAEVDVAGEGEHTLKWACRVLEIGENSTLGGCGALDYVRWTPGDEQTLAARPNIEKADTQEFYTWLAATKQITAPTAEPVATKKAATTQAKSTEVADNGKGMTLLEEFIAGTNPNDPEDTFHAEITLDANGLPDVKWEPQLNAGDAKQGKRRYRIFGSNEMTDPSKWDEVQTTEGYRFFRVTVELP